MRFRTPFFFRGTILTPRAATDSMISLLDRDLAGDFARTLLSLLGLTAILFFADTLVGWLGGSGGGVHWMLVYYILRLPTFFLDIAAIATAAAILWVAARKARSNELLAWMAGGITPRRIAAPLVVAALLAALATLVAQETFAYKWRREADNIEEVYQKGKDRSVLARSENIYQRLGKGRIVVIDKFDSAEERMDGLTIIDLFSEAQSPKQIIRAERAVREAGFADGTWRFEDASVRTFDKAGAILSFERRESMEFELDPQVARFLSNVDDPEMMTAHDLRGYTKLVDAQGKDSTHLRALLHQKLALPVGIAVVALLMCAHSIGPRALSQATGSAMGQVAGFGGGLAWIAAYYGAVVLSRKIGDAGTDVSPALVAWLPNVLFGAWGIFAMARR